MLRRLQGAARPDGRLGEETLAGAATARGRAGIADETARGRGRPRPADHPARHGVHAVCPTARTNCAPPPTRWRARGTRAPAATVGSSTASRTASGKPLLCGDSHRALDTPSVYYQNHLVCPDFDVIGFSFGGVPAFPHFAHNARCRLVHHPRLRRLSGPLRRAVRARRPDALRVQGRVAATAERYHETMQVRGGEPVRGRCHGDAARPDRRRRPGGGVRAGDALQRDDRAERRVRHLPADAHGDERRRPRREDARLGGPVQQLPDGGPARHDRLPDARRDPDPQQRELLAARARLDGRARVAGTHPARGPAAHDEPGAGLLRHREQPHRRRTITRTRSASTSRRRTAPSASPTASRETTGATLETMETIHAEKLSTPEPRLRRPARSVEPLDERSAAAKEQLLAWDGVMGPESVPAALYAVWREQTIGVVLEGPLFRTLAETPTDSPLARRCRSPPACARRSLALMQADDTIAPAGGRDVGIRARRRLCSARRTGSRERCGPDMATWQWSAHPPDEPAAHALRDLPGPRGATQSALRRRRWRWRHAAVRQFPRPRLRAISRSPACPSTATASIRADWDKSGWVVPLGAVRPPRQPPLRRPAHRLERATPPADALLVGRRHGRCRRTAATGTGQYGERNHETPRTLSEATQRAQRQHRDECKGHLL